MQEESKAEPFGSFANTFGGVSKTGEKIGGAPGLLVFFGGVDEDGIRFPGLPLFVFGPGPIFSKRRFVREIEGGSGTEDAELAPVVGGGEDVALELEDFARGVQGIRKAFQLFVRFGGAAEFQPTVTAPKDSGDRILNGWHIPHNGIIAG